MNASFRAAGLSIAVAFLAACGSSGGGSGLLSAAPVASAGPDQSVARGALVTLDGTRSYARRGGALAFRWDQVAGPGVSLSGGAAVRPTFVAPAVFATLRFRVTVTDGAGASSADEVQVVVEDQAPVITSLFISPTSPITTDPLVATAIAHDPDPEDVVTLAWEWRRNGAVVAGETGATLPASLTTRGDVFTVTVRATDGAREASATASVTIRDAPATFSVSIPDVVTWGEPVAFTATLVDPDGDAVGPGACVLRRGPAGMTVSSSCDGAWTPTLPMFDRELAVTFEIGLAGSTAGAERTVRVVDPARRYPLRRTDLSIPVQQNGLVAIDPDGDGTSTLLVAATTGVYELGHAGGTYQQLWSYPFATGDGAPTALDARDVDGDGRPEIFVSSGASSGASGGAALVKLDGVDRREVARVALGCLDLELADLDRDGALDLVCLAADPGYGSTQRIVLLDPVTLATTWASPSLALGTSLAVGNVDADAALEIVTAGGYVLDGATHAFEWTHAGGFGDVVDTGDLDGDGVEEIVGMDQWNRFRGFSAVLKSPLWEQATGDNDALLVADVDRDGVAEIVVGDGQWGNVTAYRYRLATNDLAVLFQLDSQEHGVTSITVADLDGDGAPELAWGSGATSSGADAFVIAGRNPQIGVEWRSGTQLDGPFVGAVPARTTAGASPALLFETARSESGYGGARLVRLDPSGAVSASAEIGTNWSAAAALAVADVDADGVDEAFLATANLYDGYLVAWDFAAGTAAWASPAQTGAGRAIVAADVSGDGTPDLVTVTAEGYLVAFDVRNTTLLFKSTSLGAGVNLAVADLDGDGAPEIVALGDGRLVVFHRATSGPAPWLEAASVALSGAVDLAVADCDGDGTPELYVLAGSYSGGTTVRRFDAALVEGASFAVRGSALALFVEELGTGRKNLVLAHASGTSGSGATRLEAVDALTGGRIWESPALLGTVPRSSLHYLDVAGRRAIAFGTTTGMVLTR